MDRGGFFRRSYRTGPLTLRLPLDAVVADRGRRRKPGFHVARLEQVWPRPAADTPQFSIEPVGQPERSRLAQTARFRPRGLLGVAYWYGVMPLHGSAACSLASGAWPRPMHERV